MRRHPSLSVRDTYAGGGLTILLFTLFAHLLQGGQQVVRNKLELFLGVSKKIIDRIGVMFSGITIIDFIMISV